jgi:membrane protein YqaA with SNARE-associated domain
MLALPHGLSEPAGPAALFIGSFLASTLLPGGSEAMLLFALSHSSQEPWLLWLVATLGNTLGGLSSWWLGRWLARRFPGRDLNKPQHRRALQRISRYGSPVLLLSWLPVVGDPLCVAAGWSGVRLLPAAVYIGGGKALRYAAIMGAMGLF